MKQIKHRNMLFQVGLMLITFGLYAPYWFYQTAQELKIISRDEEAAPGLWTILLFIPLTVVYSYYKYSEIFSRISSEKLNKWIIFILLFLFSPAVWFLVQRDLNAIAKNNEIDGQNENFSKLDSTC